MEYKRVSPKVNLRKGDVVYCFDSLTKENQPIRGLIAGMSKKNYQVAFSGSIGYTQSFCRKTGSHVSTGGKLPSDGYICVKA